MKQSRILITSLFVFFLLNFNSSAYVRPGEEIPVPQGVKVVLELDKDQYYFGESILLHFCLENQGKEVFSYDVGSDYRGSSRALRFKVMAKDKDGNVCIFLMSS